MALDTGVTVWLMVSAMLFMLMTPGVGLFYGGLVRKKNFISMLALSFVVLALVSIHWVLIGYSLAFGPDVGGIIGNLNYLVVRNGGGENVKIDFEGDRVLLASSPDASQLYCIGGNQNLESCLGEFTDDPSKDLLDLGEILEVEYLTRKAQGNFEPVQYFHKFGEERRGSEMPRAIYDKLRKQVFFAGGEYKIEQPGIIN